MVVYAVQVESGAWYQIDFVTKRILRWQGIALRKARRKPKWLEYDGIITIVPTIHLGLPLIFVYASTKVTTDRVIARVELSKLDPRLTYIDVKGDLDYGGSHSDSLPTG